MRVPGEGARGDPQYVTGEAKFNGLFDRGYIKCEMYTLCVINLGCGLADEQTM